MRHNYLSDDNSGDHWAVNWCPDFFPGQQALVLVQLQKDGEQVRAPLTAEQAEEMSAALLTYAAKARAAEPIHLDLSEEQISTLSETAQKHYRQAFEIQQSSKR